MIVVVHAFILVCCDDQYGSIHNFVLLVLPLLPTVLLLYTVSMHVSVKIS
jgi:hypothetical protein